MFCNRRWRSSIQLAKIRPEADCGSDHELITEKFRIKLKKVGKTTRPFGYDLNQIPYGYTVEVTNAFKGLDLIDCLKNYGQRFITSYRRRWPKPSPRKMQESKVVVWWGLTNSWEKKKEVKGKGEGKDIPIWMQSTRELEGEIRKTS